MPAPLSPEKRARIVALGRQNVPLAVIAKGQEVAEETVRRALRAAGLPPRRENTPPEQIEKIALSRREGKSIADIASDFELSPGTVSRLLRKAGEPPILKGGRPAFCDEGKTRRLLVAAAAGTRRKALAYRFGYRNAGSLNSTLYRLRKEARAAAV